jgi:hypothetical protein
MATKFFTLQRATIGLALVLSLDVVSHSEAAPPRTFRKPTQAAPKTSTQPKSTAPTTKPAVPPRSTGNTFDPPPLPSNGKSTTPSPLPPQPVREGDQKLPDIKPVPLAPATVKPAPLQPAAPQSAVTKEVPLQPTPTAPSANVADADGKYTLRYRFSNGETVRWQVEHTAKIITSVQGTTQTAETVTVSRKVWKVVETRPGGETRFIHSVEAVNMKQKLTGRQETTYDSETDKDVPPIFADAAKQVGVPLAEVVIDARGQVIKREDKQKRPENAPTSTITLVLPDVSLAIGESWTSPFDLKANDGDGKPHTIKARHKLTLEKVENGIAVLKNETQILSPITDPSIEAQVVQSESSGHVWFDVRAGRIVSQESDLDKEVFGFQGAESKLHYTARFREALGGKQPLTATKPTTPTAK